MKKLLAVTACLVVSLTCGRADSPVSPPAPAPDTGALVTAATSAEIRALLAEVFPQPLLSGAALVYFSTIERDVNAGRIARARGNVDVFIRVILRAHDLNLLKDPPGPRSTEDVLAELIEALLAFVGLDVNIHPGMFDEEGAFEPCGPAGCEVVTGTEFAGVVIPPGALRRNVFILIRRLQHENPPLDTDLDQYPLFYDFSTVPPTPFDEDVLVGLCVVDPPDPFAPDPDIVSRLRLAHPDGEGDIEILPLASAPFLDCDGATTGEESEIGALPSWLGPAARLVAPSELYLRPAARLLEPDRAWADPGNLGASASSFSPFAAVDTLDSECCSETF